MNAQDFLRHLEGVRKQGDGHEARCPAHEDKTASLSVSKADGGGDAPEGSVLLKCHAGCTAAEVVSAMGLKLEDLYPEGSRKTKSKIVATYDYCDEGGKLLFQVVRKEPKTFRQRKPQNGTNGPPWTWSVKGVRKVPYHLPELLSKDGTVFIPEGEKDVDNLTAAGLLATCNAGGAGKWTADLSPHLRDREVVILPDNHKTGRDHGEDVARALVGIASSVKVVELPDLPHKGDVSDWLANGGNVSELSTLVAAAPQWVAQDSDQEVDADIGALAELSKEHTPKELTTALRQWAAAVAGLDDLDRQVAREGAIKVLRDRKVVSSPAAVVDTALSPAEGDGVEPGRAPSQATLLVQLVEAAGVDLFHDAAEKCYATLPMLDHSETWPLRNKCFRAWLAREFFQIHGKTPGSQAIADATNVLTGKATYDGHELAASLRVAGNGADVVYLDLADSLWRAVEITRDGWRVVAKPPMKFRRAGGMLPLPDPESGGKLDDLRNYVNVSDEAWPLLLSWLIGALKPTGPYPVLCLHGEQGSAKSTVAGMLRALVDPNSAGLRAEPRTPHDLAIAAGNAWVVAYDNLSSIKVWLSDALCRLATGGAFATRELYSDDSEVLFEATRPLLLTGINEVATRSDLLDRSMLVNLPRIPNKARRQERDLWEAFDAARPKLLGALCDAVSHALDQQGAVKLEAMPRMADFAAWVVAAEPALGLHEGEFMRAYVGNQSAGNDLALEASPIWLALQTVLKGGDHDGTASELMGKLESAADDRARKQKGWPGNASALSRHLNRLAPNLRAAGYECEIIAGTPRRLVIAHSGLQDCGNDGNPQGISTSHQEGQDVHGDDLEEFEL